ncbi:Undecaprenyl pyrophosphate synthetase [Parasphingorhabdus marina DSM 22363]|uniref:Isoprenyl transferase n=1 Tax=Parasphingorhabdus marina DSM 22363 TaxID=1123272 RepID=A0A1N6GF23_9SPHN|nr:Undecaprenyl pyrophosphate synthetase [Parasphingorhabdus marina DSM 22363]
MNLRPARKESHDSPATATTVADPTHGAQHVAIIMDGNGRWAKKKHLPRALGHKKGVEAVRNIVRAAGEMGINVLTLYAFSSENWSRPEDEISDLMGLLRQYIQSDIEEFVENGIKLKVIGNYKALEPDIVKLIEDALDRTAGNDRMVLAIALNYGAQDEIVRAMQNVAQAVKRGELTPEQIAPEHLNEALDTADLPPLDLLIRTSGEIRLSNFLLWQAAYSELYFTDVLWPDFDKRELQRALKSFGDRQRRFGGR